MVWCHNIYVRRSAKILRISKRQDHDHWLKFPFSHVRPVPAVFIELWIVIPSHRPWKHDGSEDDRVITMTTA